MRTMIVEIQVDDDADPNEVHEQANAMWNPRDESESEAVVWDDATAFVEGNKVLARLVLAGDGTPRPMRYAYGGRPCCEEDPAYTVTRSNVHGTHVVVTCAEHRDAATDTSARYVSGWGDVTTTVHKIERGEDPWS